MATLMKGDQRALPYRGVKLTFKSQAPWRVQRVAGGGRGVPMQPQSDKNAAKRSGAVAKLEDRDTAVFSAALLPPQPHTLQELRIVKCLCLATISPDVFPALSTALTTLVVERTGIAQLPASVCDLKSLKELRVQSNRGLMNLPVELGRLAQLQKLNVSGNQLTCIPVSVSQLTNLRVLNVSNNRLLILPCELHLLSSLKDLTVSGNPLVSPPAYACRNVADLRLWLFQYSNALKAAAVPPIPFLRTEPFDTNAEKKDGAIPLDVSAPWFVQSGGKVELIVEVGICETNGRRPYMEDRFHTTTLKLNDAESRPVQFYGVYDGHEGDLASDYCALQMHKAISRQPEFTLDGLETAQRKGYAEVEEYLMKQWRERKKASGTTAVTAILAGNVLSVAWVGDSRAVLAVGGKAQRVSRDHKPTLADEEKRIRDEGGKIDEDDSGTVRVNGILSCSRALGDPELKNPNVVSPVPEVKTLTLTPRAGMLILGTDGVFDFWSDQQLVDFVSRYPAREGCDLSMKRRETNKSLNKDNATIIVIKFHWRVAMPGDPPLVATPAPTPVVTVDTAGAASLAAAPAIASAP